MVSWLAKQLVSHNMSRLRAGDPGPTLRMEAEDVQMRFPGDVDVHLNIGSKFGEQYMPGARQISMRAEMSRCSMAIVRQCSPLLSRSGTMVRRA